MHIMMRYLLTLSLVICLQAIGTAQPVKTVTTTAKPDSAKSRAVKYTVSYGAYGNGAKAFVSDMIRLMTANPKLKVKDDKGNEYTVVSFDLTWKKKDVSDDIRTGKPKTVFYYVGGSISGNTITDAWKEELNTTLKAGEEITFSTILFTDPKRKMRIKAPSLVISFL